MSPFRRHIRALLLAFLATACQSRASPSPSRLRGVSLWERIQTTAQLQSTAPPGTGLIGLELKTPDLVQLGSGKYTITIATDGSCLTTPADLQTRTYSASVASFTGAQAGDGYTLTLDSPPGQAFEL
jgi:hypothetical protein